MSKLSKYIKSVKQIIEEALNKKALNEIALPDFKVFEAVYKERIFVKGKATDGKGIGQYDTKPFYVNPSSEALRGVKKSGFKPMGKNGKSKFKNGKSKKTKYLKSGYSQFRSLAGRNSSFVDLNLSGASLQTIQAGIKGKNLVLGFTNQNRLVILESQEARFKKDIFKPTKDERGKLRERVIASIQNKIKTIL
jgi:hypothetical protein